MKRIETFSIEPTNISSLEKIAKIKRHARSKGITFSFYMLKAIDILYLQLVKLGDITDDK